MGNDYSFGDLRLEKKAADFLKEIGNIGSAHAATALSELLRQPVGMETPSVELVPFDDVTDILGGPEQVVACVYLRVEGEITGSIFFIQTVPAAKQLLSPFLDTKVDEYGLNELEMSALGEFGNIMAASYLGALMDFTHLTMHPSVPLVAIDMAQAVLNVGLQLDNPIGNFALIIHASIHHRLAREDVHLFLLPDPGTEQRLMQALGIEGLE